MRGNKRPAPCGSGPGIVRHAARLPGRSRGAGEIETDDDRGKLGGVHDVLLCTCMNESQAFHPLDMSPDRGLG